MLSLAIISVTKLYLGELIEISIGLVLPTDITWKLIVLARTSPVLQHST